MNKFLFVLGERIYWFQIRSWSQVSWLMLVIQFSEGYSRRITASPRPVQIIQQDDFASPNTKRNLKTKREITYEARTYWAMESPVPVQCSFSWCLQGLSLLLTGFGKATVSASRGGCSYLAWWVLAASLHQMCLLSVFPGNKFALSLQTRDICQYSERRKYLLIPHLCELRYSGWGFWGLMHPLWHPPFHSCLTVALYWQISVHGCKKKKKIQSH